MTLFFNIMQVGYAAALGHLDFVPSPLMSGLPVSKHNKAFKQNKNRYVYGLKIYEHVTETKRKIKWDECKILYRGHTGRGGITQNSCL